MQYSLVSEDAFTELVILREKVAAVLDCIIDELNPHDQTLTYIASDYLSAMRETIQAMQKNTVAAPVA